MFDYGVTSIVRAHAGNFDVRRGNDNECRVLAEWVAWRFAGIVGADHSGRAPKPLVHAARDLYDEKTVDDQNRGEVKKPILSLVGDMRVYGREEHCHVQRANEVAMFVRFLDARLTLDQLCFFLRASAWILQRCVSANRPPDPPIL
jgi:hypothetical protein